MKIIVDKWGSIKDNRNIRKVIIGIGCVSYIVVVVIFIGLIEIKIEGVIVFEIRV